MTTFLLVPGAGGDAGYWYRVVPLLQAAGYEAVAVTLPNHDGAGLSDHADAIVAAAESRTDVVMVAQSMGGFAAPLACARLPVSLLIYLNAMIPMPGETPGTWWGATGQGQAKRDNDIREGRDPDAGFDPLVDFFNEVPPDVVDQVLRRPAAAPADSVFASPLPMTALPVVRTTVISAADDRFFPLPFQHRVARERLGITPAVVPGGHLVAFGRPVELVAEILAQVVGPASPTVAEPVG